MASGEVFNYNGEGDHSSDKIALITTEWHKDIIDVLYDGSKEVLDHFGVAETERIVVPGAFEIPFGSRVAIDTGKYDGIIALGCIIKGETNHDEYIAYSVTQSIGMLSAAGKFPILLGILTVLNKEQAWERAGGTHGHKGKECAVGLLQLLDLKRRYSNARNPSGFKWA